METLRKPWLKVLVILALVGLVAALAACAAEATPTPTPRAPTPTPRPPTPTPVPPTPIPPTPTPLPPGVTPPPATATPTPLPPTPTPTPKPPLPGLAPSSTYTDEEWAQIVAAAKKEGKLMLTVPSSFIDWKQRVVREGMKETYGIEVSFVSGSASVAVERVRREQSAGIYTYDAMMQSPPYLPQLQLGGYYRRIDNLPVLKDAKDSNVWVYNPILSPYLVNFPLWWPGISNYSYSTRVVPPERVPQRLTDLLDPWWKETKICSMDPGTSAGQATYTVWPALRYTKDADWLLSVYYDLFHKDAGYAHYFLSGTPDPSYTGECGLEWHGADDKGAQKQKAVQDGVTWLVPGSFDDPPLLQIARGQGIGVLAKAPHPNAALVFVNWLVGKEGMTKYVSYEGFTVSSRRDVPDPVEDIYLSPDPAPYAWIPDFDEYVWQNYLYSLGDDFKMKRRDMSKGAYLKAMKNASLFYWNQYPPPQIEPLQKALGHY